MALLAHTLSKTAQNAPMLTNTLAIKAIKCESKKKEKQNIT